MNLVFLLLFSIVVLTVAYRTYGRYVSRIFKIDDTRPTPAHTHRDEIDYLPTRVPIVLGHHFASIAGAGPIVGPIIAVSFGWIPAIAWILLGGIFFGAVHDLTAMMASIRHEGKSIGEVIQRYIGRAGYRLFMVFAFATLILIIGVFLDIVARTFISVPSAASSSMMFIVLAVAFGKLLRNGRWPLTITTVIGVVLMYLMVYGGTLMPLSLGYWTWVAILMLYCLVAATAPVWILLQPRDYLNSFLLYGMIGFGAVGILWERPSVAMDSEIHLHVSGLGPIFPILFITIACGAISGFHSMVASGTTSKQINRESDVRRVGFGGMLIESFLAVIAVASVIILSRDEFTLGLADKGPVTLFSEGLGGFISSLGIPPALAVSFVALTVSAFAVTTLDTCTRLARFVLQEILATTVPTIHRRSRIAQIVQQFAHNRYLATLLVVLFSLGLLFSGQFRELWPIFGAANQLLAAIALLAGIAWLKQTGTSTLFLLIPMIFMFSATLSSLAIIAFNNFALDNKVLGILATVLFALASALLFLAKRQLISTRRQ